MASGARDSPAVIIVENLGENRFTAVNIPPEYRAIGSSKDPGRTLAFAAFIGDRSSSLTLESNRGSGKRTEALISVAVGSLLFTKAVTCSSEAAASIVLSEKPAVEVDCHSPPTLCSFGSYPEGQSSIDRRNIDRQNARIIFLGRNSEGNIRLANGRVCVASPAFDAQQERWDLKISGDLAALAKNRCSAKIAAGLSIASPDVADCVFDAPDVVANERWLNDCFHEELSLREQTEDTAYVLFIGDDGAGVCSQVEIPN
jgi:hypothetical protein